MLWYFNEIVSMEEKLGGVQRSKKKKKKVASTSSTHLCILYYGYDMIYGNLEYVLAMLSWTLSFPFIPHQIFHFIPHQIFPFFFL